MPVTPTPSFYSAVTLMVADLGWQFEISSDGSQIIAFPWDHSLFLRFARAGGAAPAIAVELTLENGAPVDGPPIPPIWLLPYDLSTATAARQIRISLITPYQANLAQCPSTAA